MRGFFFFFLVSAVSTQYMRRLLALCRGLFCDVRQYELMTFRLHQAKYDALTERAYVEFRNGDDDGGEQLVVVVFTYRNRERLTRRRVEEEVVPPCTKKSNSSHVTVNRRRSSEAKASSSSEALGDFLSPI